MANLCYHGEGRNQTCIERTQKLANLAVMAVMIINQTNPEATIRDYHIFLQS
jgi:hypothetical protein